MITLYLDKFRGFHDTIIPFEGVNFLVGENSTGKSSVLNVEWGHRGMGQWNGVTS